MITMDILSMIQEFGFPVTCVVALAFYANSTTNKLICLTERVTNAMSENSNSNKELAETIRDLVRYKEGEQ